MQQEAKAQGKKEPDKAFEQRLEALKRSAKSRSQVMLPCTCVTHDSVFQHRIVQGLQQRLGASAHRTCSHRIVPAEWSCMRDLQVCCIQMHTSAGPTPLEWRSMLQRFNPIVISNMLIARLAVCRAM